MNFVVYRILGLGLLGAMLLFLGASKANGTPTLVLHPDAMGVSSTTDGLIAKAIPPWLQRKISGIAADSRGKPLVGVTVAVKGANLSATSDSNGVYSISIPEKTNTLVFTLIGYETVEIDIENQHTVDVTMREQIKNLDEVVVVGYGTMKRRDLTGSIASVKSEELVKMPVGRVDQALQGRASGVYISNDKGQPGSAPVIRIRGDNSISGDNSPLVVVDGILDVDMSTLNPAEVESVEILKDASAKAIYGSRGSNGVILITTKRGTEGKARFDFNSYNSISEVVQKLDLMTAQQQYEYLKDYPEEGSSYADIQGLLAFYDPNNPAGTDWQDQIFRDGRTQNYALSAYGGGKNTKFSLTTSYFDQEGLIKNTDFERMAFRANLTHELNRKINFGANVYMGKTIQNNTRIDVLSGATGGAATYSANLFSPIIPAYDENGNYSRPYPPSLVLDNPVAIINERQDVRNALSGTINLFAEYQILSGLKLKSTYSRGISTVQNDYWAGKALIEALGIGTASIRNQNSNSWLNENTLTYNKTMGAHRLTLMGGFTASETTSSIVNAGASEFPTEALTHHSLELGAPGSRNVDSGFGRNSMLSYLGRINYILNDKYILTANFRADGSSRFAVNNKWGYFPSAAVSWLISEEKFIKNVPAISNLKLRLSYGATGSQAISSYQSLANYANRILPLGDVFYNAIVLSRVPNPDLKWETTTEGNIGIDLGLFRDRFSMTVDAYEKYTKDLLYSKNIPSYTGYTSQIMNIGSVKNWGVELSLHGIIVDKSFRWESNFNISYNRNKVVDLGDDEFKIYDASGGKFGSTWQEIVILKVGEPLGNFYGYLFDGIYQNDQEVAALPYPVGSSRPGMIKLKDISGPDGVPDGQITADDRTIMGNGLPDYIFGWSNDFSYRNFDLNIMLQGTYGNETLNLNRVKLEGGGGVENRLAKLLTESWHGEGTSNTMQKIDYGVGPANSRFVEDGSYLRVKNVILGYTLPANLISRWKGISSLRFHISAQNLFTFTHYTGYDPEINSRDGNILRGIDDGGYPTVKSYSLGFNLNF